MVIYRKRHGRAERRVRRHGHRDTEIGSGNIDTRTADRVLSVGRDNGLDEYRCRKTGTAEARRHRAMLLVVAAEYAVAGGWQRPWQAILDAYHDGYVFADDAVKEAA